MGNKFVTYDQALALMELGFDWSNFEESENALIDKLIELSKQQDK